MRAATVAAVLRRRAPLLLAALALLAAAVGGRRAAAGRGRRAGPKAARAEPLAYVPAGSADVVFDLDTREPLVALAVEQLAPRVTHGALTADQAHALVGGRAAVAIDAGKAWLAFATDAPAPRPTRAARRPPARDGVVVVAPSAADLARGRSGRARPSAKYARATFDKRFAGLPAAAGARVAFDPQVAARPALAAGGQHAPGAARSRRRRRADRRAGPSCASRFASRPTPSA